MQLEVIVLIIFGLWLVILTFVFISFSKVFGRLIKGNDEGGLKKALDIILAGQDKSKADLSQLESGLKKLEEDGIYHVQKLGLIRFNPFKDLGGEHSFSLAILNGRDTGVIITGLHNRERTRIYMKEVKAGKCEYELSSEEKRALVKAQKS